MDEAYMNATTIESFGGIDVFREQRRPRPRPAWGQVLIRVQATSVNPLDYKIRGGHLKALAPAFPAVLHGDVAGIIEEIGEGVSGFHTGDEVYGCVGGVGTETGVLADFALADCRLIARRPTNLTATEAASLPLVGITAWEALVDRANIRSGQRVLIHGGTGGVGHVAIQIAKIHGAIVHATVSTEENAEIARSLGADVTINYQVESTADYVRDYTGGEGYAVVFDTVGGQNLETSIAAAATGGKVLTIQTGDISDVAQALSKGLTLHFVLMLLPLLTGNHRQRHGEILAALGRLTESGKLRPLIAPRSFSRAEIGAAHEYAEHASPRGKVTVNFFPY